MIGSSRFRSVALLLAGLGVSAAGAPIAGQAPDSPKTDAPQSPATQIRLRGVVIDAGTYTPVDAATVALVGSSASATTSQSGVFELPVPAGAVALHVSAPGHATVVVDLEVLADRPAYVQVPLPSIAVTLSELLVQARGDDDDAPRGRPARTAAELVAQQLPRASVNSGQVGQSDFGMNLRSAATFSGPAAPTIVVDGVVLSRGSEAFEVLDRIPAADVEDVQVLRGPSAAFLYPMAANGVILVTTRRGQGR